MSFTQKALQKAKPYWEASFQHPFIKQLQDGSLPATIFRYYLLQDRYYLEHFAKIYELAADRATQPELQAILLNNAASLQTGELFIRQELFNTLAISQEEIEKTPIAPTAYHYVSHIYRQFTQSDSQILFASLLPCPWLYYDLGVALNQKGSPNPIYQSWIETYDSPELKEQITKEAHLIDQLYRKSSFDTQKAMIEAFVISAKMEYQFWEMAYSLENWPLKGAIKHDR